MESRRSPSPAAAVLFAASLLSSAVTGTPAMGTTKTTRRSKRKDPKVRTEKTNDNLVNVNNVTIAEAVEDVSNQGELTRTTSGGEGSGNLKTSAGGIWRVRITRDTCIIDYCSLYYRLTIASVFYYLFFI